MEPQLASLFEKVTDYAPGGESKLPSGGGVYLLADEHDRPIQLASAADLARALRHRLSEAPEEPATTAAPAEGAADAPAAAGPAAAPIPVRRPRLNLGEIVRRIYWQPAHSAFELTYAYYHIARQLYPNDYLKQVGFGPAWFVHVDPAAGIPRFQIGKLLRGQPGVDIGPMATQADAGALIDLLQDAFDLCRYQQILDQVPHGQPCAYYEMGRCPAPCNGSIPMSAYRASMEAAVQFALGRREPLYEGFTARMREAAASRAFERAGMIKQRLERARRIEHEAFRYLTRMDAFDWLIVQRGGGTTRVRPFFVSGGAITPGEAVPLKTLDSAMPAWIAQHAEELAETDLQARSEHVWLVSHFLFKPSASGLYLRAQDLTDPASLAGVIREHFKRPERPATAEDDSGGQESKPA